MADGNQKNAADVPNSFVQWRHATPSQWKFCPLCGSTLVDHVWDGKSRRYCERCGFVYWDRPLPATAAIVYDRTCQEVVVVTRRYPPFVGGATFPGGGVESGESLTEAVLREVYEETGLTVGIDGQLGTWSTPSKETMITFFLAYPYSRALIAGSDALEAHWVKVTDVPPLAFSVHQQAFDLFRAHLRLGTF